MVLQATDGITVLYFHQNRIIFDHISPTHYYLLRDLFYFISNLITFILFYFLDL